MLSYVYCLLWSHILKNSFIIIIRDGNPSYEIAISDTDIYDEYQLDRMLL